MGEITESSEPRGGSNPGARKACQNLASSVCTTQVLAPARSGTETASTSGGLDGESPQIKLQNIGNTLL